MAGSGAGLAYSNGLRSSDSQGRVGYYAERTPELPQTVRFVVGVIKDGQPYLALGEAVMAQAFGESRASACTPACCRATKPRAWIAAAGSSFVIGPDKQLDAWEQYLQGVEGPGPRLQRLSGRDLWMT